MGKSVKRVLSLGLVVMLILQPVCVFASDNNVEIGLQDEYIQNFDEIDFSDGEEDDSFMENDENVADDFLMDETLDENSDVSDIEVDESNMISDEEILISSDEYESVLLNSGTLTSGDYEYTLNDDSTATIVKYCGTSNTVIIPSVLDNHTVTSIGNSAFYNCTNLTKIEIPDNVTEIGARTFEDCKKLSNVKFQNQ
jgi:hypothetical protein